MHQVENAAPGCGSQPQGWKMSTDQKNAEQSTEYGPNCIYINDARNCKTERKQRQYPNEFDQKRYGSYKMTQVHLLNAHKQGEERIRKQQQGIDPKQVRECC